MPFSGLRHSKLRLSRRLLVSVALGAATAITTATTLGIGSFPTTQALAAAPAQASAGVTTLAAGGTNFQVFSPEQAAAAASSGRW
jgi:thiosulfate/3-mercaptopyruvate sulfurtransferase